MTTFTNVLIIGAGFSGICAAIELQKHGVQDFKIVEKSCSLGGTWRDNRYPGSGCDVPAILYQFSFELNPDWSKKWVGQQEILQYIQNVASKHTLLDKMIFDTEVESLQWCEEAQDGYPHWKVQMRHNKAGAISYRARFVLSCVGQLNRAHIPPFKGLQLYTGKSMHSAQWDEKYDLSAKRVAIVGNAASACQIIPEIVPKVEQLSVYQRTANYYTPALLKRNSCYTKIERFLFRYFGLMRIYRIILYLQLELFFLLVFKFKSISRLIENFYLKNMRKVVASAQLQEKLVPQYRIGCKRILITNNFYKAIQGVNVELITDPIKEFCPEGIISGEGQDGTKKRVFDCVIFATGFKTQDLLAPMHIIGRGGRRLFDAQQGGVAAYLGVTVPHFPNFFILYGPNTNLGSSSILLMIEAQARYARTCIQELLLHHNSTARLEVREDVFRAFNEEQQAALQNSQWAGDCGSWYTGENGRITHNWHATTANYWWKMRKVSFKRDYILTEEQQPHQSEVVAAPRRSWYSFCCPRRAIKVPTNKSHHQ